MKLQEIIENFPDEEFLKADGFDDAVIGIEYKDNCKLVYDITKIIEILVAMGMTYEEANEYFDFNIASAHVGEKTPIYVFI